jgi:hypothetical protein
MSFDVKTSISSASELPSLSKLPQLPLQAMGFVIDQDATESAATDPMEPELRPGPFPFVDDSTAEIPCSQAMPYEFDVVNRLVNDVTNDLEVPFVQKEPKTPVKRDVDPKTRELQRRLVLENKVERALVRKKNKIRHVTPKNQELQSHLAKKRKADTPSPNAKCTTAGQDDNSAEG